MSRIETTREKIGAIIQAGTVDRKTSDEIAGEIMTLISVTHVDTTTPIRPPVRRSKTINQKRAEHGVFY